jgi:CRISPR system Cascade subunit CasB
MNATDFFSTLQSRSEVDTSIVASLRRSIRLDPGTDARVFPIVEPWTAGLSSVARQHVYLTAGLWAMASRRTQGAPVPLAEAVRRITSNPSTESRFTALLDADADELRWRLRQVIALLSSSGVAVDWPGLLEDLMAWNRPSRSVQIRWAQQFWAAAPT